MLRKSNDLFSRLIDRLLKPLHPNRVLYGKIFFSVVLISGLLMWVGLLPTPPYFELVVWAVVLLSVYFGSALFWDWYDRKRGVTHSPDEHFFGVEERAARKETNLGENYTPRPEYIKQKKKKK